MRGELFDCQEVPVLIEDTSKARICEQFGDRDVGSLRVIKW